MLIYISADNPQEIRNAIRSRLVLVAFVSIPCVEGYSITLQLLTLNQATALSSFLPKANHEIETTCDKPKSLCGPPPHI